MLVGAPQRRWRHRGTGSEGLKATYARPCPCFSARWMDACWMQLQAKTSSGVVQAARASSRANHEKSHTTSSSRLTSRPVTGVPIFASGPLSLRSAAPLSLLPPLCRLRVRCRPTILSSRPGFAPTHPDRVAPNLSATIRARPSAPTSLVTLIGSFSCLGLSLRPHRFFLRSSTRQDLPSSRCPPRSSGRWRQHRRRPP